MDDTGSSGHVTSARERAHLRDQQARARLGLNPHASHGDVGPDGDLVDELRRRIEVPAKPVEIDRPDALVVPPRLAVTGYAEPCAPEAERVLDTRARRLARCITAANPLLADEHLRNVLAVVSRRATA